MAAYVFDTITAAQALAFTPSDTLSFQSGTATQVSVAYLPNGDISVTVGARTVEFSGALSAAPQPDFSFADGTHLYVGDATNNVKNYQQDPHLAAMFGGGGNDILTLGQGGLAQGNQGDDQIVALGGTATIYGGQGDDFLVANGHDDFIQGNKGNDFIQGGTRDTILGGQGDDAITRGSGILDGNLGNDQITGSGQLLGEDGNDTITGNGTAGGFDTILGGNGNDSLTSDQIGALSGASMDGGEGNDTILGGTAQDTILGGNGDDRLDDIGIQRDVIDGGAGDDTISVTNPKDVITGGPGADLFVATGVQSAQPGSVPQILDWSSQDSLQFRTPTPGTSGFTTTTAADYQSAVTAAQNLMSNNHFAYVAVQVGPDTIVFATANSQFCAVDLVGRSLADISAGNIVG